MKYGDSLVVAFMEMNYAIMASFQHSLSLSLSLSVSRREKVVQSCFVQVFISLKLLGGTRRSTIRENKDSFLYRPRKNTPSSCG